MANKSKLYTRTGDNGTTQLVSGNRVPKNNPRVEAYGTVDELNATLGLLASHPLPSQTAQFITHLQNKLFDLGAYLATDPAQWHYTPQPPQCTVTDADINALERQIDNIDAQLPPMHAFLLPGGTTPSAIAQIARTVCRRAERQTITLGQTQTLHPNALTLLNRLSDYLFALARQLNHNAGHPEIIWQKNCNL